MAAAGEPWELIVAMKQDSICSKMLSFFGRPYARTVLASCIWKDRDEASAPLAESPFLCTTSEAAKAWVEDQRLRWQQRSRRYGTRAADQLHPSATLHYAPSASDGRPLLLLGGMGPMAGLAGFEQAHAHNPKREIILHQACRLPCRTQAIEAETRGDTRIASMLLDGLADVLGRLLPLGRHDAEMVMLCNTVHHFIDRLDGRLLEGIRLRLLPDAAIAAAVRLAPRRLILLTTEGSRLSGHYARAAKAAGLSWCEPDDTENALLQRAIFGGVKRGDEKQLLAAGDALFQLLAMRPEPPDALLAGCTEIPFMLDVLRRRGSAVTRAYLDRVATIDPVAEALKSMP